MACAWPSKRCETVTHEPGAMWLAARVWYVIAYLQDPPRWGPPFGLSMLVFGILSLGAA